MRRALVLLAAAVPLALASCSVDVEGAPCTTPGGTEDCPPGQACGNDRRCSARAGSCLDTRCEPGSVRCASGDTVETCTGEDPVCGLVAVLPCGPAGLVCGTTSGVPACECPAFEGPEFAADRQLGSASGSLPFPTGAASPEGCRFESLADAVARAAAVPGSATVRVLSAPAVFDETTGDVPLVVPANVTVVASPGPPGVGAALRATSATDAPIVTLHGRLEGLQIVNFAATGAGIAMSCGATGKPSLEDVAVDGGGLLGAGIDVTGACGAELSAVAVEDVSGPALAVRATPGAAVTVLGGALRESQVGARVEGGVVTFGADPPDPLAAVELAGNAGEGVLVPPGAVADVRLHAAEIHGNGGTGVVVDLAGAGSALALRGCSVQGNGSAAPRTYGPGDPGRPAGGILLVQGALPFTFVANRVYANAGDQLAFESSGAWSIAPGACGPSSNVFACVAEGAWAVAVVGGTVDARNNVWPALPVQTWTSGGVTTAPYCNELAAAPPLPDCP